MSEIYFSIDIESDGPIPGMNSMLSLGCVAFDQAGKALSDFSVNLYSLDGASTDPETAAWWATQPEAWKAVQTNKFEPLNGMVNFVSWVEQVSQRYGGKPVALAYPAGFDFTFVYWYLRKFVGRSPFGFQCLDLKSFAFARLGETFRGTSKKNMPKEWFDGLPPHTHLAVDDAREQGLLFFRMRDWT